MKIHELRFKNLNSLHGEWVIDFTDPEYAANGIFALTGATGAGKSTILDGLCLALYGATPRLGKITRSSNEIMSRQTGECYAEVIFESQAGRFRCHWEQRRARKQSSGKLQDQQHQIIDADTGRPIETKKSLVVKVIEEKTGMDFDRFTRSILLAQGGFDTFLKADDEQKSRILEQITGTEIYSTISRRVHERQRGELEKLNLLKAETSGIRLLDPGQEREIEQQLEQRQKEETDLTGKFNEIQRAVTWLDGIEKLKNELSSLAAEELELRKRRDNFTPERLRLEEAVNAAALEGEYATLVAVRTQRSEDQASLERELETLPELEAVVNESAEALKSAEQQTAERKKERDAAGPLLQRIRSLDQSLDDVRKNAAEIENTCKKESALIEINGEKQRTKLKQQEALTKTLKETERYLTDHADDKWLVSGLAGIEVQLASLQQKETNRQEQEDKHTKAQQALSRAAKEFDRCTREVFTHRRDLQDLVNRLKKERKALSDLLGDRLLREYRQEKEHLLREQAFIQRIFELEEHRDQLKDGSPCPLCGATEHPFARGNVPPQDQTEKEIERLATLIDKAEEHETAIRELEEGRTHADKKLTAAEKRLATGVHEQGSAEKMCSDIAENINDIGVEAAEIKNGLAVKLELIGISDISDESGTDLLKSLRKRLAVWQEQVDKKAGIGSQLREIEVELKRLEGVIETQAGAADEHRKRFEREKKKIEELANERKELFGDKRVDDEAQRLIFVIEQAEKAEKRSRAEFQTWNRKLDAAQHHIEALKKRIDQSTGIIKKSETDFETALKTAGFRDEQQFLAARLRREERDALSAQAKELDSSLTDLAVRKRDRENRLHEEAGRDITDEPLEELGRQSAAYEESLKRLRDEIAGCKHQLEANNTAHELAKQKQAAIELQKKECDRWDKLHQLIGSADGKKYRTFAQGLTFELMVSHANRQLVKMSDRYLLIRDPQQPLELNVVDNYQAGEVRSTRNLSGGESFMVSLALALGLSGMASRNVRVDSLFLDEGFGTLDEDALESALATLSALQQENKIIGIISHVPALKDRISTQISVTPLSGGRSTLTGPGCTRLQ